MFGMVNTIEKQERDMYLFGYKRFDHIFKDGISIKVYSMGLVEKHSTRELQ